MYLPAATDGLHGVGGGVTQQKTEAWFSSSAQNLMTNLNLPMSVDESLKQVGKKGRSVKFHLSNTAWP